MAIWLGGDAIYWKVTDCRWKRWESGVVRDADGVRVGCRDFTMGDGDVALLMIHGFADSPATFRRMAPRLAADGFTCRAMRLPGFAEPMDRYRRSTREQWRATVRRELEMLRASHRRVFVVAHSLGGAIAADVLMDHPDLADGVVMLAPLMGVSNRRSPILSAEAWYSFVDPLLAFSTTFEMAFPVHYEDEALGDEVLRDEFVPRNIYRAMFQTMRRVRGAARRFEHPVLMVLSSDDKIVDAEKAQTVLDACGSTDKQMRFARHAKHVLTLDTGWEETTSWIRQFVGERSSLAPGGLSDE